jgi:tripartite-type tricarboxylate transporter receptor subunit TctC
MISSSATHSSGPQLVKKIPYDSVRDFTHIGKLNKFDVALVVNPAQGFKTIGELIAEAKKNPDKLTYGYGSATSQVIAASFARATGIQVRAIPYKGQPLALNDLMGGQITLVAADLGVTMSHLKSGRIVALGVASDRRSALLASIPTLTELGINDVELSGWTGVAGPAGLPRETVTWWSNQISRAFAAKDFFDRLQNMGIENDLMAPDAFGVFVKQQFEIWGRRIREVGIQPE